MPMYEWKSNKEETITVLRSLAEYDVPPTEEETTQAGITTDAETVWSRVIGTPKLTKGYSWGPGKGNWGR